MARLIRGAVDVTLSAAPAAAGVESINGMRLAYEDEKGPRLVRAGQ
jgi:hypothetical protein